MAKKRNRIKLSPEEKERRRHIGSIQRIFSSLEFKWSPKICGKDIEFKKSRSEIDDYFIYKNVHVLVEYTTTASGKISGHLKKKDNFYKVITENSTEFLEHLNAQFTSFNSYTDTTYSFDQCHLIILYCSLNPVSQKTKEEVNFIKYLDFKEIQYFNYLIKGIYISARTEFLSFLGLNPNEVGEQVLKVAVAQPDHYNGSLLPESHSNYERGFKVVTFYIDPKALLERAYVLRKDGWRDKQGLYQRMINNRKIKTIRTYLKNEKRVFINNIIITLPSDSKIHDDKGNTVDPLTISKTTQVTVSIPSGYNSIGIIDGQHRLFAYYEGGSDESQIYPLRIKQNLLATGIVYPDRYNEDAKMQFEARLFLEINSNQQNANTELKQRIGLIIKPFTSESIGRRILLKLNDSGPFSNVFQRHIYDRKKLKTTSIVSFGLRPLVKLSGTDSIYSIWSESNKEKLLDQDDFELLVKYVSYCEEVIRDFFIAVKSKLGTKWKYDRTDPNAILSTVFVNGWLICLRILVENNKIHKTKWYLDKLQDIEKFNFSVYKSSQYSRLANDLYKEFFDS